MNEDLTGSNELLHFYCHIVTVISAEEAIQRKINAKWKMLFWKKCTVNAEMGN